MKSIYPIIALLRPKQWVKNVFVFFPFIFSGEFHHQIQFYNSLYAFFTFCAASSLVYTLNDVSDAERDRLHPKKKYSKPIASGAVTIHTAIFLFILLTIFIAFALINKPSIIPATLGYIILNFFYTFCFKNYPIFDIFSISAGFVLRVYAGTEILNLELSYWMALTTFCLSLFLASTKRRQELILSGSGSRVLLKKYSENLLAQYTEISANATLIFYSIFITTIKTELVMTLPLVIFGLFRYKYICENEKSNEDPTEIVVKDNLIICTVILWCLACLYLLF